MIEKLSNGRNSMMRYRVGIAIALALPVGLLLVGCEGESRAVSIINLLVDAKAYRGDRVIVHGFAKERGGFLRLYMSREDALMANHASSIVVRDESPDRSLVGRSDCHDSYVEVIGEVGRIEGLGLYGIAKVESVTRFDLVTTPPKHETCWPPEERPSP